MKSILVEVEIRCAENDERWGGIDHDLIHDDSEFVGYILRQASQLLNDGDARERFLDIAALAAAAVRRIDEARKRDYTSY